MGYDIIPAIDLIDGSCVRLTKGDYDQKKVYGEDPLEFAKQIEDAGLKRLHLVDLDGAKSGGIVNYPVLERIASKTSLVIDFGGGIKKDEDIKIAFESGAAMVTGGSIAVKEPGTFLDWFDRYGPDRLILGADVKNGLVAVSGWMESSDVRGEELILSYMKHGIRKVISTEISKDGMLEGPSYELYRNITEYVIESGYTKLELIASGGVTTMKDVVKLYKLGLSGVIVGKAIYEGRITLKQLSDFKHHCL